MFRIVVASLGIATGNSEKITSADRETSVLIMKVLSKFCDMANHLSLKPIEALFFAN